jgi:hypothetical protein
VNYRGRPIPLVAPPEVIRTQARPLVPMVPSLPEGLRPYRPDVEPVPATPPLPNEGAPDVPDPSGFETRSVLYTWPWSPNLVGGLGPVVYTSRRRWNACDVYFSVNQRGGGGAPLEKGVLSILIYAVSATGKRTLVASGRAQDNADEQGVVEPMWIAAARGSSQRWEVVLAFYQVPGASAANVDLTVTVVLTDDTTEPPPLLGAIPIGNGVANATGRLIAASATIGDVNTNMCLPNPQLVGLQWVNAVAATAGRFLQYFETSPIVSTVTVPILIWPLGSLAGDGFFDWQVRRRPGNHIQNQPGFAPGKMAFRVSSTANVYTAVAPDDCFGQTWIR